MKPIIQVAGIKNKAEAQMLISHGVDCLGFPFCLTVHQEDTTLEEASRIITDLRLSEKAVLITYLDSASKIRELCRALGARRVQIHGSIDKEQIAELRQTERALFLMKSLVVGRNSPSDDADRLRVSITEYTPFVDAFITDTYDAASGASGATGKTHNWEVSRHLVFCSKKPVILAGGLTPDNVGDAIRGVRPAGVDAHTGLEDVNGLKDPALVASFVQEARTAFAFVA